MIHHNTKYLVPRPQCSGHWSRGGGWGNTRSDSFDGFFCMEKWKVWVILCYELMNLDSHWIPAMINDGVLLVKAIASNIFDSPAIRHGATGACAVRHIYIYIHTQVLTHLQIHGSWSDICVAIYNFKDLWRYSCRDTSAFGHGFPGSIILLSNGSALRTKCLVCFGYEGTENAWRLGMIVVIVRPRAP